MGQFSRMKSGDFDTIDNLPLVRERIKKFQSASKLFPLLFTPRIEAGDDSREMRSKRGLEM
jgi:hypothetical protein